jgi:hypothetical protein
MGEVIPILLIIAIIGYIGSTIYHYLKQNFLLLWFLIYYGGAILTILWFLRIGILGRIPYQTMQFFLLFLISPFFGHLLKLSWSFWRRIFGF